MAIFTGQVLAAEGWWGKIGVENRMRHADARRNERHEGGSGYFDVLNSLISVPAQRLTPSP